MPKKKPTKKKVANKGGRPATGRMPMHGIRCWDDDWSRWQKSADAAGLALSEWIRQACNRAAGR